jgi:hypothetical protein
MGHAFKTSSFLKINLPHNIRTVSLLSFLQTLTGAHEYIRGTHRQDLVQEILARTSFPLVEIEKDGKTQKVRVEFEALFSGAGYDGDAVYKSLFGDQMDIIEGKPGSAFFSDPSGLHHGRLPEKNARLLVWIRYGLYRNRAYQNDELAPVNYDWAAGRIPDSPRHRHINRLLLDDSDVF